MSYIAGNPIVTVSRQTTEGAATSGQTVIPIPGGFAPGMCDVFVGGAALSKGDYDDSSGTQIVLTQPMSLGTQYRVVVYAPGQTVQQIQLNAPAGNRNYIVDGRFDYCTTAVVNLSGNSGLYTNAYMWLANAGTAGAASVNIGPMKGGTYTFTDSNAPNYYYHNQTTASTGSVATSDLPNIAQRIEDVAALAGRSVTLSAKIWSGTGSPACTIPGILVRQNFGTGGSPSAANILDKTVNWVLTVNQPKRYSVRIDLPNANGKTFGTNNNDFTAFGLWLPASYVGSICISEVQVEVCSPTSSSDLNGNGGAPTPYEWRGYGPELARGQRYYEGLSGCLFQLPAAAIGTQLIGFNTTKRAIPAVALSSITYVSSNTLTVNSNQLNMFIVQLTASAANGYASFYALADVRF